MYIVAIILTVVSTVFYHLVLKQISPNAHPILLLSVAYIIAFLACILSLIFFPIKNSLFYELKQIGFSSIILGIVTVGIELGFLFAYRTGWSISVTAMVSNIIVTLLLVITGKFFFKENLSLLQYFGILFSILGISLIQFGKL